MKWSPKVFNGLEVRLDREVGPMSDTSQVNSARITFGIDLGDRYSEFYFVDAAGTVLENGLLRTVRRQTKWDKSSPELMDTFPY